MVKSRKEVASMRDYFTIRQVCRCCGVSRATVLRLEQKGLLRPAFVDADSGYRYYDNNNVSWVMQVQLFLGLGMSYDDIQLYYRTNGTSHELLQRMDARLTALQRARQEIALRVDGREVLSFDFLNLPAYVCFARSFRGASVEDSYMAMYRLYHEAVERGYRLLPSEPLFLINERRDFLHGEFQDGTPVDITCCIPLDPTHAPKDAVVYPACRVFSCLYHGDYTRRGAVFNALGAKVRELGLRPAGPVRVLGLVAPYTSLSISADDYVTRLALPVEE